MADPYVIFPGTAGNYVSTEDVNLLDADTAHLQQSTGTWGTTGSVGTVDLGLSSEVAARFGEFTLKAEQLGSSGHMNVTTGLVAASTGTEISFGVWIQSPVTTSALRVGVSEYQGSTWLRGSAQSYPALVAGEWQYVTGTFVCGVNTDSVEIQLYYASATQYTAFYVDSCIIREGPDPTFVPSMRIVGDLDIRADIAADDWTPAGQEMIVSRWGQTFGDRHFYLYLNVDGNLNVAVSNDGTDPVSGAVKASTVATGIADGSAAEVRATVDVDNGASGWDVDFYVDGVKLGATVTTAGVTSLWSGGDVPLLVGTYLSGSSWLFDGDAYSVEVRDGIDGPVVARFDAGDVPQPAQLPI